MTCAATSPIASPRSRREKNGKRIACIGAGPASLTVANDLMPLGYEVVIFEQYDKPGGLMRSNIPSFRLPEEVLEEETAMILDMGVDIRYNSPVTSLRSLLDEGFDAVFVGVGAPRGKELDLPGRHDEVESHIFIGIDWLESVAFGHVSEIGERVLIIGVGNTAMDCCRTSRRLGGRDIKVMARRPRQFFKASPWELDDAEEEGVEILVNYAPTRFVLESGRLVGMEFDVLEWDEGARHSTTLDTVVIPCDDVILAIGQENSFPWIERDLGMTFGEWDMPVVDEVTMQSSVPGVFFGGDAGVWAEEHHLGGRPRPRGGHLDRQLLPRRRPPRSPGRGHEPHQPEDGHERVELPQRLQPVVAPEDDPRRTHEAIRVAQPRSRTGIQRGTDRARSPALSQLRRRDRLHRARCASSATRASTSVPSSA